MLCEDDTEMNLEKMLRGCKLDQAAFRQNSMTGIHVISNEFWVP